MDRETYRSCVDPALEVLKGLRDDELTQNPDLKNPIRSMQLDLRFFKMFFWGFEFGDETENDLGLLSLIRTMSNELRRTVIEYRAEANKDLHMSSHFVDKLNAFKPHVRKGCTILLGGAFKCKSFNNLSRSVYARETDDFIGFILDNLELLNLSLHLIAPLKQQIWFIEGKLKLFRNFVNLVSESEMETTIERFDELLLHTRTWANHMSCLACLYWIDDMDKNQACTKETVLSDLMQKTMPHTPEVMILYFNVFRARSYQTFEIEEIRQLIQLYVDFLLENLDGGEILRQGLIFLLTFVTEKYTEDSKDGELILTQIIDVFIDEAPYVISSIHVDEMTEGISLSKTNRSDFLQEIDRFKAEVVLFSDRFQPSFESNFPRTKAIAFLDFLLGNLKKMLDMEVNLIAPVKHQVQRVWEELASLRPIMQNILELQNEHEEIKDLGTRIINVVYKADYAIKLSLLIETARWYSIILRSSIIEDIKLIKIEAKEIQDHQVYKNNKLSDEESLVMLY